MSDEMRMETWVCPECGAFSRGPYREDHVPMCRHDGQDVPMRLVWPAPSGWISVSDPPKTAGTHWIIWHGGRGAWMEAWWRDDSWWDSMGQIYGVTHYQPGPSAPE